LPVRETHPGRVGGSRAIQPRGLAVVAINSNDVVAYPQDGPDAMRQEARALGYTFPYLLAESQGVARAYRAACTPDFFLFDAARLVYRASSMTAALETIDR
jgi:hypothetical protein